jgi:hypothetical protein
MSSLKGARLASPSPWLRTRASDAWRAKDLATVVNAYEEIESELKTVQLRDSERGRLEYARKHLNPDGDL